MSEYLTAIKANEARMQEIEAQTDKLVLEYKEKVAEARHKPLTDPDLSPAGQQKQAKAEADKLGAEFLCKTKALNTEYTELAVKTQVKAEFALADSKPTPADPVKAKLFEAEKAQLQTALMLATNDEHAETTLKAFIGKYANEPAFAADLAQNFSTFAASILTTTNDERKLFEIKYRLFDAYNDLQSAAQTEEYKEANKSFERASNARNTRLFGVVASEAVTELFGRDIGAAVNSIELAQKHEDKIAAADSEEAV
ncbi:hypothetical protein [Planococcus beigongshangi]|uniref:hypothetical protein n=1 Tax=Planococcus beigongshangi TaxID=2782536 RepID=UPI00193BA12D|nr:hypothetical protein [Planococcus beigongshangi]